MKNYVFALFLGIVAVLIAVSFAAYRNLNSYIAEVAGIRHSSRLLRTLQDVRASIRDAEAGHRGYQLTRDTVYLEPYYNSLKILPRRLRILDSLVAQNESQRQRVDSLGVLINNQYAIIAQILSNAQRSSLYMDVYESALLARGRVNMDQIWDLCVVIADEEERTFSRRVENETIFRENLPIALLAYSLVSLIGITYLFTRVLESLNKRRAAEERLRENLDELKKESAVREFTQKTLRSVLDNSLDAIMAFQCVRNSGGRIINFKWIAANKTALGFLGRREEEVIGQRLLDVAPQSSVDGVFDTYIHVVESGEPKQLERKFGNKGSDHWYFVTCVKFEDGLVVTMADITTQKVQRTLIEERGLLLQEAESLAHMGSWRWYETKEELTWSDGLYKIWGLTPLSVKPSWNTFQAAIIPSDRGQVEEFLDEIRSRRQGGQVNFSLDVNGSTKHLQMSVRSRPDPLTGSLDIFGGVIDVTPQKLYERQLKQFTEELQRSNQDLEQFAYVASHDLQEPLRKIRAFGDRLVTKYEKFLEVAGVDYVHRMQQASARMQVLIEDLLAFSRVSRANVFFEPLDLTLIMREVTDDLEVQIRREGAVISYERLPKIKGERTQIKRLMQNLINNAIKFHHPDSKPHVQVSARKVSHSEAESEFKVPVTAAEYMRISVKDNGIGIDEKYSDKIFNIFQRLHTRMEYEGTGIGLAICRKIVSNHDGFITVVSKEGYGSEFIVILPV